MRVITLRTFDRGLLPLIFIACLVLWPVPLDADSPRVELEELDPFGQMDAELSSLPTMMGGTLRRRRGRPRKFAEPSRAVTLTLPEAVLDQLAGVDPDLSRAVVRLADRGAGGAGRPPADLSAFGRRAVITIKPSAMLERRTGLQLVPLPDGRALIAFGEDRTIPDVELTLHDALEDPNLADEDRKLFTAIAGVLRDARRSDSVVLLQRNIIVLESAPRRRDTIAARRRGAGSGNGTHGSRGKS